MMKTRCSMLVLALGLAACAPGLDWREVRPAGAELALLFPCKPEIDSRTGAGLAVCKAEGLSFSLSWAEIQDPALVGPALQAMRESLGRKLQASAEPPSALVIPGMSAYAQAQQQLWKAGAQQARVAVFARGLRVYQLVLMGKSADAATWETFLSSLRLNP